MALFILAEKHKQEKADVRGLQGQVHHISRYVDEVDNSKTRPDKPKIYLSYLQGHAYELVDAWVYDKKLKSWALKFLPIYPKQFKHKLSPSFIKTCGGRKHMNELNKVVDKCDEMWPASDPDLEGEGLVYEPIDINGWRSKVKITGRVWYDHGLTKPGMIKTFKHDIVDPKKTEPRATASHAREEADWMIGINISRLATDIARKYGYKKGAYTAGRVQTPTLALITARRGQRQNFTPVTTYRLAFLDKNGLNFLGNRKGKDGKSQKAMFKTKDEANTVANDLNVVPEITNVSQKKRNQTAPKLPKTNDMQGYIVAHAHVSSQYAANKVLEPMYDEYSAQTYPRTECNLITIDDFNELKKKLPQYKALYEKIIHRKLPDKLFTNMKPRRKYVDFTGKKVQKQGHGAITPDPENKVMSYDQYKKLNLPDRVDYRYVLGSTLAMFADDHAYSQLKVEAKSGNYTFNASNRADLPNDTDWKQLFPGMDDKKKKGHSIPVSDYKRGAQLAYGDKYKLSHGYYAKPVTTSAPEAITEANLVHTIMPKYKLGTSSTRSGIIASLKRTKLIKPANKKDPSKNLKKNEFVPTNKGIIDLELLRYSHLLNLSKVASWEDQMKKIAHRQLSFDDFIKGIKEAISDDVKKLPQHQYHFSIKPQASKYKNIKTKKLNIQCPKCHKGKMSLINMDMNTGKKYIPISFYSCSNRKCNFSVSESLSGLKVTPDVLSEIIDGELPMKKLHSYRKNTDFKAKIFYNKKKKKIDYKFPPHETNWIEKFGYKCPKCHKGQMGLMKTPKSHTIAYACTNPKCKFFMVQTLMGVKLSDETFKDACQGETAWIRFSTKKGPRDAKLSLKNGKFNLNWRKKK